MTQHIEAGKSSFVMKQRGWLTNDSILLKAHGKEIGHINEGYFYDFVNDKIEKKELMETGTKLFKLNNCISHILLN